MRKHYLSKALLILLLTLAMVFSLAACGNSIDIVDPTDHGTDVTLTTNATEARSNVSAALSNHLAIIGQNSAYTLSAKLTMTLGDKEVIADITISVDTVAPENTMMRLVVTSTDSVAQVFYRNGVLFGTGFGDQTPIQINGINLTDAVNNTVSQMRTGIDFSTTFNSTLSELTSATTLGSTTTYVFNSKINLLMNNLLPFISEKFGSEDVVTGLLSFSTIPYSELINTSNQSLTFELITNTSGAYELETITLAGTSTQRESFNIKMTDMSIEPVATTIGNMPEPDAQYADYSFDTVTVAGTATINIAESTFTDISAMLPAAAQLSLPTFGLEIDFSVSVNKQDKEILNEENIPVTVEATYVYIVATIPGEFFTDGEGDRDIKAYYDSTTGYVYVDLTTMNMGKLAISTDSADLTNVIVAEGESSGIDTDELLSLLNSASPSVSGSHYDVTFNSSMVERMLEAFGLVNFLNISTAEVSFDWNLMNANQFLDNFSANLTLVKGSTLAVDLDRFIIGFGLANIEVPTPEEYIVVSTDSDSSSHAFSALTNGVINLPNSVLVGDISKANDLVESAIKRMTGMDVEATGYRTAINYLFVLEIDTSIDDGLTAYIELSGENIADSGLLLVLQQSSRTVTLYKSIAGVYNRVATVDLDTLNDNYSIGKLTSYIDSQFSGDDDAALTTFLFAQDGLRVVVQTLEVFLGCVLNDQEALENATVRSIAIYPNEGMRANVSMTKNVSIDVYPDDIKLYYEPLSYHTTDIYEGTFSVYGSSVSIPVLHYSVYVGDVQLMAERAMQFDTIDIEVGSGDNGYLVYDIAGRECKVPAADITNVTIKQGEDGTDEIRPKVGAVVNKYVSIITDSSFDSDSYDSNYLYEYLHSSVQYVQITLLDNTTLDLPIEWDDEYNTAVLDRITTSGTYTLKYYLRDSIGRETYRDMELRIAELSTFPVSESQLSTFRAHLSETRNSEKLEFFAYGGVDPTLYYDTATGTYNYPRFYNVVENAYTNVWDPTSCLVLEWDLSSVQSRYQDSTFTPATATGVYSSIFVNFTATNVFGYTLTSGDVEVKIYNDQIGNDRLDFTQGDVQFSDGIAVVTEVINDLDTQVLTINPLKITELKANMLTPSITIDCLTAKSGDDRYTDKVYQVKWKTNSLGNVIISTSSDYSLATSVETKIENGGLYVYSDSTGWRLYSGDSYIFFSFGDTIGKSQIVAVKVNVLTRSIEDWSVITINSGAAAVQTYPSIGAADIFDLTIPNAIDYIRVTVGTGRVVEVFRDDKVVLTEGNVARTMYTDGTFSPTNIPTDVQAEIRAYYDEFIDVMDDFDFVMMKRTEVDEVVSYAAYSDFYDVVESNNGSVNAYYTLGTQMFTLTINYVKYDNIYATNRFDYTIDLTAYEEYDGIYTETTVSNPAYSDSLDTEAKLRTPRTITTHLFTFNPYGDIDFTKVENYPSQMVLRRDTISNVYDIRWDISQLTTALSSTQAYEGLSIDKDIKIYATITCITNLDTVYTDVYEFSVVILKKVIGSEIAIYEQNPAISHGFVSRNYDSSQNFVIDVTPITIVNDKISIFDARTVSSYANYIGVAFDKTTDSMWIPVYSWDISAIQTYFGTQPLNSIANTPTGSDLIIKATVGNSYGGYQTVEFRGRVLNNADVSIYSFEMNPKLLDGNDPYEVLVDDGVQVLYFDPYSIDVADSGNYPRGIRLDVEYTASNMTVYTSTSSIYAVTWDLSNLGSISYNSTSSTVYAYVAGSTGSATTGIRIPVIVRTQQMDFTKQDENTVQYTINVAPLSAGNGSDLANLFPDAEEVFTREESGVLWVYYRDSANRFYFSNGKSHDLYVKFRADFIPDSNSMTFASTQPSPSSVHIEQVMVGNDWAGYQYIYNYNGGVNPVDKATINIQTDYQYITEIEEVGYTFNGTDSTFNTLPAGDLLSTMRFTFRLSDGTYTTSTDINSFATSSSVGVGYLWLDKSGNIVNARPYAIRIVTRVKLGTTGSGTSAQDVFYEFASEDVIVRESIDTLFTSITKGGIFADSFFEADGTTWKSVVDFMWDELYVGSIEDGIMALLSDATFIKTNVVMNDAVIAKYADAEIARMLQWGTVNYYLASEYYNGNLSNPINTFSKPDEYVMVYSVRSGISEKYYGSAVLPFAVSKKDISNKFVYYSKRGENDSIRMNDIAAYTATYANLTFNFSVLFTTDLTTEESGWYNGLSGVARYYKVDSEGVETLVTEIRDAGNYLVKFVVMDGAVEDENYQSLHSIVVTVNRRNINAANITNLTIEADTHTTQATDVTQLLTYMRVYSDDGMQVTLESADLNGTYYVQRNGQILNDFSRLTVGGGGDMGYTDIVIYFSPNLESNFTGAYTLTSLIIYEQ